MFEIDVRGITIDSTEEDILAFCGQRVADSFQSPEIRKLYLEYASGLLAAKQQRQLLRDQHGSSRKLIWANWGLVMATIFLAGATIYFSWIQHAHDIDQESAGLMLQISDNLRSPVNSPLVYAIAVQQKPLLQINGGKFSDQQLDNYLVKYELLDAAYQKGLISYDMVNTAFGYDLTTAYNNPEVRQFMKDVRAEGSPDTYAGFEELSRLVLNHS